MSILEFDICAVLDSPEGIVHDPPRDLFPSRVEFELLLAIICTPNMHCKESVGRVLCDGIGILVRGLEQRSAVFGLWFREGEN